MKQKFLGNFPSTQITFPQLMTLKNLANLTRFKKFEISPNLKEGLPTDQFQDGTQTDLYFSR